MGSAPEGSVTVNTEKASMESSTSRRQLLQMAAVGAAASLAGSGPKASAAQAAAASESGLKFRLGMASYTFRKFDLDQALKMTARLKVKAICLKDMHLALDSTVDRIQEAVAKVKAAGLELYAGGVIYMRNEDEVRHAFDYAKAAGMKIIVGVPNHELLPLVNDKVKQYDISVAIHNHGPTDKVFPTPESAYELIKGLDRRVGLCMDIGHTMRSGIDPSVPAEKYGDRLLDIHVKDVSAATAQGSTVEMGRGVIDLPKFFRTLVKTGYSGTASLEHEKDENDPLAGAAESVGYMRGILASL
jgi:sugar phosphate isomerase/epimerase